MKTCMVMLSVVLMYACAPRVTRSGYTTADLKPASRCELAWQRSSKLAPPAIEELGRIRVGDTGFSRNCEEEKVREMVSRDACGLGAHVVDVLTEHQPTAFSTCYHVDARLLAFRDREPGPRITSEEHFGTAQVKKRSESDRKVKRNGLWLAVGIGVVAGVVSGVVFTTAQ